MRGVLFTALLPFLPCAALASCTANKPPPNPPCGKAGVLKRPSRLGAPQKFSIFTLCLDLCARHQVPPGTQPYPNYGCISFSYSHSSGLCELYQETLAEQGFMASTDSSTKYWNMDCFTCSPVCPQFLNTNLIDNGDFEQPLLGPWRNDYAIKLQSPGVNSSQLAFCNKENCEISQMFETCQHSFYHLGFQYKAEGRDPAGTLAEVSVDLTYADFPGTGEWQFLEMWFQAPSAKSNDLDFFFYAASTRGKYKYSLDNVRLHQISGNFSTRPGAQEMVLNGGFESGQLRPWHTRHTRKTSFKVVNTGIKSAHGLLFSGHAGEEGEPSILSQILSLNVGSVYLLRYTIKKLTGGAGFGYVSIGGFHPYLPATQITNGTLNFALPFRAVTSKVILEYQFFFGDLLIDNVSVKPFVEGDS